MLLGSHFAGIAFSNASTNLAHASARPLGARFQLPHGLTVALTLPPVVHFGLEAAKDRYEKIAAMLHTDDLLMYLENLNETFEIYEEAKTLHRQNGVGKHDSASCTRCIIRQRHFDEPKNTG